MSKWSSYIGYWWQHNCFRQETYKIICLAPFQARNESTGLYSHVFSANWSWLWLACGVDKSSLEHTHNSNVSSQNTTNIFYFYDSLLWLGLRDALFFPKGSIFHYLFMFCCLSFFSSRAVVQWNTCRCLAESVRFSNLVMQWYWHFKTVPSFSKTPQRISFPRWKSFLGKTCHCVVSSAKCIVHVSFQFGFSVLTPFAEPTLTARSFMISLEQ